MRFQGRDAARGRRMRKDLGRTAGAGVALALLLFLMPALLVRQGEFSQELLPQGTLPLHRTPSSVSAASQDRGRVVRLSRSDGTVEELTMEEYLWGVVAAEMPASFEEEALKAQACAARTYTVTLQEASSPRHPDAQICDDSGCCQAYLDRAEAEELYRELGRVWRRLPQGWRTLVLSSHTEFERTFGRPADKKRKLYNGMLKCDLFMYGNV